MNSLTSLWSKLECPILNGVMFAEGFAECVEPWEQPLPAGTITLVSKGRTLLEHFAPLESTGLIPSCRAKYEDRDTVVIGGEGGMGGDGFVAVTNTANELRWIAFFEFSNPFVSVELCGDEVLGTNNHGEVWHFSLREPSKVRIDVPATRKRHN